MVDFKCLVLLSTLTIRLYSLVLVTLTITNFNH